MKPKAIRGMNDVLPEVAPVWAYLEEVVREVVESYGYREIRLPIVEQTELFRRSIGEVTDIVEKEMYSFDDRNGESLTLRPEATAGMVRAGITHGFLHNQRQKLWTVGPMFRYEKPQQGRYRQFHQFDVEAMGYAEAGIKPPKEQSEVELPVELVEALECDLELADAFHKLTPGRKKSYAINLNSAKKRETRISRIAKFRDKIIAGKGALER